MPGDHQSWETDISRHLVTFIATRCLRASDYALFWNLLVPVATLRWALRLASFGSRRVREVSNLPYPPTSISNPVCRVPCLNASMPFGSTQQGCREAAMTSSRVPDLAIGNCYRDSVAPLPASGAGCLRGQTENGRSRVVVRGYEQ